jgi:hypothetical protein
MVFSLLIAHSPQQLFSQLIAHNSIFHNHGPTKHTLSYHDLREPTIDNCFNQTYFSFPATVSSQHLSHTLQLESDF